MEAVAGSVSTGAVLPEGQTVMEGITVSTKGLDSPGAAPESQNQELRTSENNHLGEPDRIVLDSPVVEEATEVVTTSPVVEVQPLSEQVPDPNNSHNNHRRKQQNPRTIKCEQQYPTGAKNLQQSLHWAAMETQVLSPADMMQHLYIAVPNNTDPMEEEDIVMVKPAGSLTKRERDKLKKRELRSNPVYREKEKERARERMRLKRADPNFRAVEREKDRKRRRLARQRNELLRRFEHNKIRALNDLDSSVCRDDLSPGQYLP